MFASCQSLWANVKACGTGLLQSPGWTKASQKVFVGRVDLSVAKHCHTAGSGHYPNTDHRTEGPAGAEEETEDEAG